MSDENLKYVDEINLVDVLETIYEGRIKIIITSVIAILFGILISFVSPKLMEVKTPIYIKSAALIDFLPINEILKENNINLTDENLNGYVINANIILTLKTNLMIMKNSLK